MPVHTATLDFTVGYMSSGTCQGTKDVAVNPLLRSTTFSKINNKKKTGVVKNSKIKNSYKRKRKKKKKIKIVIEKRERRRKLKLTV